MNTGRNNPCPCGSGKKFKQCCLAKQSFAQAIADEISETAAEQPFSSLEDLNAFAQQRMDQRNLRKYRGKFVLTQKCKKMLVLEDYGHIYFELFKAYTTKFNWGYRDGYPEAGIIQHSFLYTLFLLAAFGDVQRPQQFYEDKFLEAFPMTLDMFSEAVYSTAEEEASHCYFVRSMDRFAVFFGLAEFKLKSGKLFPENYLVRKSTLLDSFVSFNQSASRSMNQKGRLH